MSENKDAVRDQLARDIKNYLARGKVVKRYHYNPPGTTEPITQYKVVVPKKPTEAK